MSLLPVNASAVAPTPALPRLGAGEGDTLDQLTERLTYLTERHEQFTGSNATRWSPYRDELIRVMDYLEREMAGLI